MRIACGVKQLTDATLRRSVGDLIELIKDQMDVLKDLLDEYLNVFTLTFLDVQLTQDVDWSDKFGDRNIGGSSKGAGLDASLKMSNSAQARVGLFGAAFGFELDESLDLKLHHSGRSSWSLIDAKLALAIDAQVKNPMAADVADKISQLAQTALGTASVASSGPSLSTEALTEIVKLRDAACGYRDALLLLSGSLTPEVAPASWSDPKFGLVNPLFAGCALAVTCDLACAHLLPLHSTQLSPHSQALAAPAGSKQLSVRWVN